MAAGGDRTSSTSSVASREVVTLAKPSSASSTESACSELRAPSSTTRTFWNSLILSLEACVGAKKLVDNAMPADWLQRKAQLTAVNSPATISALKPVSRHFGAETPCPG